MDRRSILLGAAASLLSAFFPRIDSKKDSFDEFIDICGCDDTLIALGVSNGKTEIAKSEDWGESFIVSNGPQSAGRPQCIAAISSERLYVGCDDGTLIKTEDGGKTWRKLSYILSGGDE